MNEVEKVLAAAQAEIARMMVEHQASLNAIAIREATAKAEAAEWAAKRERMCFFAVEAELRKQGFVGSKVS
jgi:hypothetical protein